MAIYQNAKAGRGLRKAGHCAIPFTYSFTN